MSPAAVEDSTTADPAAVADDRTELAAEPAAPASRRERRREELRFAGPIVALTLGIKLMLFSYGVVIAQTFQKRDFEHFWDRFAIWKVWDASQYLGLAEHGYLTHPVAEATQIVFLPGYPLAIRAVHEVLFIGLLPAAFVVSGIASVIAAVLVGRLARVDGADGEQGIRAAWFFLIFPTAYFLHMPYTESLFMALVLGSFVAARTGRWATAGLIGMLAAFTRLNGILLIPALAVEAYLQYRKRGSFDRSFLWIGVIAVGLLVYLGINQHIYGNPFHFQEVQRQNWFKHFSNPFTTIKGMVEGAGNYSPDGRQMQVVQELLFMAIGLIAALLAFRFTRPSYGVWALLNVFLFASTSYIQSTPRYVITLFPIFLMLAMIKRQWIVMLVSAWSLAMFAWFAALIATGAWAF